MKSIQLSNIPNQNFNIQLDDNRYDITFKQANNVMAVTIIRNNETIVSGSRCLPISLLIPYRHLENGMGNFIFTTLNDDYPFYDQFGSTQFLYYISNAELEALRNGL